VTRSRLRVDHTRRKCSFVRLTAPALVIILPYAPASQFLAHEKISGGVLIEINRGRVRRLSCLAGLSLGADVSSDFAAKGLGWARAVTA
jgi:hypothetical protein